MTAMAMSLSEINEGVRIDPVAQAEEKRWTHMTTTSSPMPQFLIFCKSWPISSTKLRSKPEHRLSLDELETAREVAVRLVEEMGVKVKLDVVELILMTMASNGSSMLEETGHGRSGLIAGWVIFEKIETLTNC